MAILDPDGGPPQAREVDPMTPSSAPPTPSDPSCLTAEQLATVIRRLDTGFYERVEVRERIARGILADLPR
jgi:hypothetical protein